MKKLLFIMFLVLILVNCVSAADYFIGRYAIGDVIPTLNILYKGGGADKLYFFDPSDVNSPDGLIAIPSSGNRQFLFLRDDVLYNMVLTTGGAINLYRRQ